MVGDHPARRLKMGFLDKLLGRGKKAAGDLTGDSSMRSDGMHQEQEGMASDRAESAAQMAQEEREGGAGRGGGGRGARRGTHGHAVEALTPGLLEGGASRPLSCRPTAPLGF